MKVMGIIFSNIHDKNLGQLTENRTLASVPFGGRYRLVDFALSNMVNSDISKVGVITKANYQSLMDHIRSGKSWDLSRKNGGIIVLPPYGAGLENKLYSSRFEALKNVSSFITKNNEDYVVMTDCDNVCNMDYSEIVSYHIKKEADITVVYRKQKITDSKKHKIAFEISGDGRVVNGELSDHLKGEKNVHTNILVINKTFLINLLTNATLGIHSFGQNILIDGAKKYKIFAFEHKGFFASVDSMIDYYNTSMQLLKKENREKLFDNQGARIYTKIRDSAPCKICKGGVVENSLVADGCVIEGTVKNSILFRGVQVQKGATIENSILFQDIIIHSNTLLNCVIADKEAVVLDGRHLSGHVTHPYFIEKKCII